MRYCISNDLDTEYRDGITVGDIVLDSRNLCTNANFEGVEGIRFLIGETVCYDSRQHFIKIKVTTRTKKGKDIQLSATTFLSQEQLNEICTYFFSFSNTFVVIIIKIEIIFIFVFFFFILFGFFTIFCFFEYIINIIAFTF